MKEYQILFSTEMVKAILEDRKKQTRRTTGLDKLNKDPDDFEWKNQRKRTVNRLWDSTKEKSPNPIRTYFVLENKNTGELLEVNCPYGQPGDRLWVRETFIEFPAGSFNFKTDPDPVFDRAKTNWKPSIHMPKTAARIWLEIEEVKVERLQDISDKGAIAEGIYAEPGSVSKRIWYKKIVSKKEARINGLFTESAIECFQTLWHSINGPDSWEANPWVWVIKFKVLSTTGNPASGTN